jgi:hypothetical protein
MGSFWRDHNCVHFSDASLGTSRPRSLFAPCPSCGIIFKLNDDVTIKKRTWSDWFAWRKATYVRFLTVDEYCQAIENGLYNSGPKDSEEWKGDILSMRFELWRTFNRSRNAETASKTTDIHGADTKFVYEENCRTLLAALADAHDDCSLLTRAELHRNLDEFDQCASLLDRIKKKGDYQPYISAIREACAAKNTFTVRVPGFGRADEIISFDDLPPEVQAAMEA